MSYKIQLQNKIAKIGTDLFDKKKYEFGTEITSPDAILVRSASLLETTFAPSTASIARAGAGVNNVPLDRCTAEGIVVMNTPGANANGVKELAILALLLASRDVIGGVEWAKTLETDVAKSVETGKSAYGGTEIKGKTLGIIGLGAIGALVANAGVSLGMSVVGCDPFLSDAGKKKLDPAIKLLDSFDAVFSAADYISLHVPATPHTKGFINAAALALFKNGAKLINLSRADLVNAADLKAALASGKISTYVVDFPTEETQGVKGVISIPHLGASTEESEDNCAVMAVNQTVEYLERGNIVNSVNFPALSAPRKGKTRIGILYSTSGDTTQFLTNLNTALFDMDIEANETLTKTAKSGAAYTVVDTDSPLPSSAADAIKKAIGAARVRIIGE